MNIHQNHGVKFYLPYLKSIPSLSSRSDPYVAITYRPPCRCHPRWSMSQDAGRQNAWRNPLGFFNKTYLHIISSIGLQREKRSSGRIVPWGKANWSPIFFVCCAQLFLFVFSILLQDLLTANSVPIHSYSSTTTIISLSRFALRVGDGSKPQISNKPFCS